MCTFNPMDKKPGHGTKPAEKPSVVNSGDKGGCKKHNGKHPYNHCGNQH